jgi:hypothetical protein
MGQSENSNYLRATHERPILRGGTWTQKASLESPVSAGHMSPHFNTGSTGVRRNTMGNI